MPPMSREDYETLITELNAPDLEHPRRTEILQQLRTDYTSVHTDFEELTNTNSRLKKDNDDLVLSNSKLFRQAGIVVNTPEKKEEEQQKNFSETVTLEQLETGK